MPLDPPFVAAWDPRAAASFGATIVRVETDAGVVGVGSGDTMDGFEAYAHLFIGQDPLAIARHVRALETIAFHAGRYWPLEAALWDIVGQVAGLPVATLFGGATDGLPVYASCGELKGAGRPRRKAALSCASRASLPSRSGSTRPGSSAASMQSGHPARGRRPRWRSWSTSTRAGGWPATSARASTRRRPAPSPPSCASSTSCGSRSRSPRATCTAWPTCAGRPACGSPAAR